jgi:4-hydroxybenzoate polyprenyltransferase
MVAILAIMPFFAILLYFYLQMPLYEIESNSGKLAVILSHGAFLFLLLLIREMIKDLENLKGDFANDYRTIPIIYGERVSKKIMTGLALLTIFPVYFLINVYDVGYMDIYFYFGFIGMIFFLLFLWKWETKEQYVLLHNMLKFLIVAGVFCIILINPSVLWHGKKILMTI